MKNLLLIAITLVAFNVNAQNITVKAIAQSPHCHGDATGSIDLILDGGTQPFTFLWSNGATTSSLSNITAGSYSVTVNDNAGLISSTSILISEPNQLSATGFVMNCSAAGASDGSIDVTVRGGTQDFTYLWNTGSTAADLSGLTAGTYNVVVTDGFGCQTSLSKTVSEPLSPLHIGGIHMHGATVPGKGNRELGTSENAGNSNMEITMFPNPASNFLSVRMNQAEETEFTLFNANGQVVSAQKFNSGNTTVDVSNLPNGNYVAQVKGANGVSNKNISIVR